MKLTLYNTPTGLKPVYDADYDEKKKLKVGEYYTADIKLIRNPKLHRMFFALINLSWEYLDERQRRGFRESVDLWRQYVTVAAGYVETFYSPKSKSFVEYPKSIAWDRMDEAEFRDLYERVKDVIFAIIGRWVTPEEFEQNLANF